MDRPREGQTPKMQWLGLQGHPCRQAVSQPVEQARKGSEVQTEVALLTLQLPAPASRTRGPSPLLPAACFVGLCFGSPRGASPSRVSSPDAQPEGGRGQPPVGDGSMLTWELEADPDMDGTPRVEPWKGCCVSSLGVGLKVTDEVTGRHCYTSCTPILWLKSYRLDDYSYETSEASLEALEHRGQH